MSLKSFPKIKSIWIMCICVPLALVAIVGTAFGVKALFNGIPKLSDDKKDLLYEARCDGGQITASKGENITLTVILRNNSGEDYCYEGSYSELKPEVVLVSESNPSFKIQHNDMPYTNDFARHTFKDGDERTTLFYFTIPENAPEGSYRAEMTFKNDTSLQSGVLVVTE